MPPFRIGDMFHFCCFNVVSFFGRIFWRPFWAPNWSPNLSKISQLSGQFLDLWFFESWSSSSASWELSWASYARLENPQDSKSMVFQLEKHTFCKFSFSVLWGSWGPSWVHLDTSWPSLAPRWLPKFTRNEAHKPEQLVQTLVHFLTPI